MTALWKSALAALLFGSTAVLAQTKDVEYKLPAPGCPKEYPTKQSAERHCKTLGRDVCTATAFCEWDPGEKGKNGQPDILAGCDFQAGTAIETPSKSPAEDEEVYRRLGLQPPLRLALHLSKEYPLGKQAHAAASRRQYDKAVHLYTQALKTLSDDRSELHTSLRAKRGLIYELMGKRTLALNDYCEGLVHATHWRSERLARERIHYLTNPGAAEAPMPVFQQSGFIRKIRGRAIARLKVVLPEGDDHVRKLRDALSKREEMLIYVEGGTTFETKIPVGEYRITVARGSIWYGTDPLFGGETQYSRLEPVGGDGVYRFYIQGSKVYGWNIEFARKIDGNLKTPKISADEF